MTRAGAALVRTITSYGIEKYRDLSDATVSFDAPSNIVKYLIRRALLT